MCKGLNIGSRGNVAPDKDGEVGGDQISGPASLREWKPLKDFNI